MEKISPHEILQKHGNWIDSQEFTKRVECQCCVGERQAYNLISKDKRIKKHVFQDRSVIYGLPEFGPPIKQENIIYVKPLIIEKPSKEDSNGREEVVVRAIEKWRHIAFRDPLPEEIANETGMSPQEAEEFAHRTRSETGWESPNQAVQDFSTEKLGEVLTCLGRIRIGKISDFNYEDYPEIMKEAELGLKEHIEILPNLDEGGNFVSWRPKALKYLRKNYKPMHRRKPYFTFG